MIPILIAFLAGFSTVLGGLVVLFKKKLNSSFLAFFMAFSGGVMISLSLFDLLKESFSYLSGYNNFLIIIFICCLIGLLIAYFIDKLVPSSNNISRVGVISLIGLIIHNIPEGIATYITSSYNLRVGISFAIAIALHNIPEGIAIAVPIYYENKNFKKIFLYTSIAGLSEFLGALLSSLFLSNFINTYVIGILFSIIAGIMLFIGLFELIPTSFKISFKYALTGLLIGGIFILLI